MGIPANLALFGLYVMHILLIICLNVNSEQPITRSVPVIHESTFINEKHNEAPSAPSHISDIAKEIEDSTETFLCPRGCQCQPMQTLLHIDYDIDWPVDYMAEVAPSTLNRGADCRDQELHDIPATLPVNTEVLLLSGNRIDLESEEIGHDLEALTGLRELVLDNNHIYSVLTHPARLPNVKYVSLNGNRIDYLANSTFEGLANLRHFSVADNQIEVLHRDAFISLRQLEILIMSGNRISEIDAHWFRNLQSLIVLDLSGNSIRSLSEWNFNRLTRLAVLDLSGNELHYVHDQSLQSLASLQLLHLNDNSLETVPSLALRSLNNVRHIDLSANHFKQLDNGSFAFINVSEILLNRLPMLLYIDKNAFVNLHQLRRLEISNCHVFVYLDREAFLDVPSLSRLILGGNALSTVERPVWQALPSLQELDLQNNPLYCDCTLHWLTEALVTTKDGIRDNRVAKRDENGFGSVEEAITSSQSENHLTSTAKPNVNPSLSLWGTDLTCCQFPASLSRVLLNDSILLTSGGGDEQCLPRVVPLFESSYQLSIGDFITLTCMATGQPAPAVKWVISDTQNPQANANRELVSETLNISFVQVWHAGNYTCEARNSVGITSRRTVFHVSTLSAHIIVMHKTATTITVTWTNTHHARTYELVYHPYISSQNVTYQTVAIEPYMRQYTISSLQPSSTFQICMAVKLDKRDIPINCTIVTTHDASYDATGIHNNRNYVITGAIIVLLFLIFITCLFSYISKRLNARSQDSNFSSNSTTQLFPASSDEITDTTPFSFENQLSEMFDIEEEGEEGALFASTSLGMMTPEPTMQQ